ncbi:hypothetical protein D3C83_158430 [compost metagenome]
MPHANYLRVERHNFPHTFLQRIHIGSSHFRREIDFAVVGIQHIGAKNHALPFPKITDVIMRVSGRFNHADAACNG